MDPTPGGQLEAINTLLLDPTMQIVARLAKAPIDVPERDVALADLTEADFPGYAAVPLVADTEHAFEEEGYGELSPQIVRFESGTIVTPQRLSHLYVTGKKGAEETRLICVIPFTTPLVVNRSNMAFEFDVGVGAFETPD